MALENYIRHDMETQVEEKRADYESNLFDRKICWDAFPKSVIFCLSYLGVRAIIGPQINYTEEWTATDSASFIFHFIDRMAYAGVLLCGAFSMVDVYKRAMGHFERKSLQEAENQLQTLAPVRF